MESTKIIVYNSKKKQIFPTLHESINKKIVNIGTTMIILDFGIWIAHRMNDVYQLIKEWKV